MSCARLGFGLVTLLLVTCTFQACQRKLSDNPPPLRPLVYTEAPRDDTPDEVVVADPRPVYETPEDLGEGLYQALIEHDRQRFEWLFITADELNALISTPMDRAERQAASYIADSEALWSLFAPSHPSEAPVGGLRARFWRSAFVIGKGRNLQGRIPSQDRDAVVQHWENSLRLELRNSQKHFALRVPKIVLTKNGWKLAKPIKLNERQSLRVYLESGMHLKPALLGHEHHPFPLKASNFWKYHVDAPVTATLPKPHPFFRQLEDELSMPLTREQTLIVRVKNVDVREDFGFAMASLEYILSGFEREVESHHWLVTPKRVFPCNRTCRKNLDNLGVILGYMSRTTPTFVFPLPAEDKGWSKAGRPSVSRDFQVESLGERVEVPAGEFPKAQVIVGSIREGRETRYFVPGTGIIKRKIRTGNGWRTEQLVDLRIMP